MGNSKHMLFWHFKTILTVGGSTRGIKTDMPNIISELTAFIIRSLKGWTPIREKIKGITFLFMSAKRPRPAGEMRRILYQVKEWYVTL
jgi:hypothetical protein